MGCVGCMDGNKMSVIANYGRKYGLVSMVFYSCHLGVLAEDPVG